MGMPIKPDKPETSFVGYTDEAANKKKVVNDAFIKGDSYFRSGDLLSRDADGYWYFLDRIGDTFPGVLEANAYGVQVPGAQDGRGCMVSLTCESTDAMKSRLDQFLSHCDQNLPKYAWPLFLRFERVHEATATLKQIKTQL